MNPDSRPPARSLLRKIAEYLHPGPDSKAELFATLEEAQDRRLINAQSLAMLEGVLKLSDMTAGDVMVAAPRMELLDIDADFDDLLNIVIDTAHSRFPVFEGERDNIIGILLAKDLLKRQRSPEIHLRALLRPAVFVPESKGLNDLLTDFRGRRNHLALVVDEFGKTAGLITIEDILEEIVGEIEDEFDTREGDGASADIVSLPEDGAYRVSGQAALVKLVDQFDCEFTQEELDQFETIGGLVAHRMGHVPRGGEEHIVGGLRLVVLIASRGAIKWFRATRLA
ncbi:MAG: CBS domain-containing protein [Cytophagales bacterium]|nr:CBS domain-containing protein [Cytophagales bacterium]